MQIRIGLGKGWCRGSQVEWSENIMCSRQPSLPTYWYGTIPFDGEEPT
jgi:hypothetical protein